MHTGGEPVRIVESGYPPVLGDTILDKRRYAREHLDHLRRLLMFEPRGHYDMYGVIPVEPDLAEADMAVLFMHNEGYSTMCGHATLALGRYAVDRGIVAAVRPETRLVIQCPCGPVRVRVEVGDDGPGKVWFESVDAFAAALDRSVDLDGFGPVQYDLGYGGAFYAIADAGQFGLDVRTSAVARLVEAASALSGAARHDRALHHESHRDLGFLYGAILTDGRDDGRPSANVCVFADAQVDRSPTGSGVTARMAVAHERGTVEEGEIRVFESLTGSRMTGSIIDARDGRVTVEVGGESFYTGSAEFVVEEGDPLGDGFLLR